MDAALRFETDEELASFGVNERTLTRAERLELDERGYLVLPRVVGAKELDRLRAAFDRACEQENIAPSGTRHPTKLLEHDPTFVAFLHHPKVLAAIQHLLGYPFAAGMGGRDPLPGFGEQGLHTDWAGPGTSIQPFAATVLGMIDAFTEDNGATRLVPGSHVARRPPPKLFSDPASRHPNQVIVTAPAGSVLVFNGLTWHGGTRNRGNDRRRAVHCSILGRAHPLFAAGSMNPDLDAALLGSRSTG
jgi:ectoine hydroxylase-related dioxygenase (phytanoyl-CoA dioxygenase family)